MKIRLGEDCIGRLELSLSLRNSQGELSENSKNHLLEFFAGDFRDYVEKATGNHFFLEINELASTVFQLIPYSLSNAGPERRTLGRHYYATSFDGKIIIRQEKGLNGKNILESYAKDLRQRNLANGFID